MASVSCCIPPLKDEKNVRLGCPGLGGYFLRISSTFLRGVEESEHEAAVLLLHLEQAREGRRERHHRGIRGVDAADERLGQTVEALAAHAADHEALERLVVELALGHLLLAG